MCMIFFEIIAFTPLSNSVDIDFGNVWPNRPGNLKGRAFFIVTGAGGRAFEFDRSTCVAGDGSSLVQAANFFIVGQFAEIERMVIVHKYVYLSFNAQLRVINGFAQARTQSRTRCDLSSAVNVMNLNCITWLQIAMGAWTGVMGNRCEFRVAEGTGIFVTAAKTFTVSVTSINREVLGFVFGAFVEVDVTQIHLGGSGRAAKNTRVVSGLGINITRCLWTEAFTFCVSGKSRALRGNNMVRNRSVLTVRFATVIRGKRRSHQKR